MLRLSKLTDYGMVVMTSLAHAPADTRTAVEVADETRIGTPTVRKLLKHLAQQGLLDSTRGARGGYRLARPPAQINVAEVIAALEGPIGLTECGLHDGRCGLEPACRVRGNWQVINRAVRSALASVTLADMARPIDNLQFTVAASEVSAAGVST